MGLDVYLFECKDFETYQSESKRLEEAEQEAYDNAAREMGLDPEEINKDWQRNIGNRKDEYYAKAKAWKEKNMWKMGFRKDPEHGWWQINPEHKRDIEENSPTYPEHMFKIGYFRSSYNSGGINHVCRNATGLEGLYHIFKEADNDQYEFSPNWKKAKERCQELISALQQHVSQFKGVSVKKIGMPLFGKPEDFPATEHEALEQYKAVLEKEHKGWFSSTGGDFYLDGTSFPGEEDDGEPGYLKVRAIIPGFEKQSLHHMFMDGQTPPIPCHFLICEGHDEERTWYINALQIVMETIDYVLKQPKPENYYLSWSG